MKPKERSKLRLAAGKMLYTWLRYINWYTNSVKYARKKKFEPYPEVVYQHNSPLLRKLQDVDMWLQYNKVKNLQIAVQKLHGIIIEPGETFSYGDLLEDRQEEKGMLMEWFFTTVVLVQEWEEDYVSYPI